ncbi:hypothetical protein HMPREF1868_01058 [Olsenella sp. DNF00959]|nr:hypothetical protein HMPREF1868_01058 [Olsenella sp. DNF00959]
MHRRLDFNHASDSCTLQSTPASRARHVHATCMPHACGVHAASYARHIMRTTRQLPQPRSLCHLLNRRGVLYANL